MPSKSKKQLIKELCLVLWGSQDLSSDYAEEDDEDTCTFIWLLEICRYTEERLPVPRSASWINTVLCNEHFDDRRFRTQLRMNRYAFVTVLEMINSNAVFNGGQAPVPLQLAVALYNFGTYGNPSANEQVATKFGISEGAVGKFTNRIIAALISISSKWISWPDQNERRKISSVMTQQLLPKCIGFVDGSSATFYQAPKNDKETYWSRKKEYCMQFQVICDYVKAVRHFYTGYPGSVHDAKVFSTTTVFQKPHMHFSSGEYIVGDAAYSLSDTVIVPFKRSQGNLERKRSNFNTHLSGQRIFVEHCIGMLKDRFQSLRGLRINVDKREVHKKVCKWIEAVIVLHNMLIKLDPWNQAHDELLIEPEDDGGGQAEAPYMEQNAAGEKKRTALVEIVNALRV